MNFPKELKYTKTDEWVRLENGFAVIGISDYAQNSLSDVVYLEYAVEPGEVVKAGDNLGTVESVKAASDINIPIGGTVTEINAELPGTPELINKDPYQAGWLIKLQLDDPTELDDLLDSAAYEAFCQER
ncbi:MAG: glycine cleavage system protein GcvH [Anaerolineaceae bacterium]|jgi:glycine cleavage system H protein